MAHNYANKQEALLAKVKGKTGKISDKTHEEHFKLYTGYVNKSNALLEAIEALGTPDPTDAKIANQISSKIRDIKVDLTFAPRWSQEPRALLQHPRRRRQGSPASSPSWLDRDLRFLRQL